jgi:hypothetical protein
MEIAIEKLAAINFLVMGLSHLIRPGAWVQFFQLLHSKGEAGVLVNGFLALGMGSIIVAFHDVWTGWPAVLTVLGWTFVAKSLVLFVAPQLGLKSLELAIKVGNKKFIPAGVFLIVLGLLLARGAFWG